MITECESLINEDINVCRMADCKKNGAGCTLLAEPRR